MSLAPLSMVVGLKYDRVLRGWQDFTVPRLRLAIPRLGFGAPDLLVVDTPLYGFLNSALLARTRVYRVTDFNPGFLSATPRLADLEREAVAGADAVVYTADELASHVRTLGARRAVMVPHGVDFEMFSDPAPPPPEYARIPRPRAIYVGSLREWFDYALLDQTARARPLVNFVVVGPENWARHRLPRLPNVHVLGERRHEAVPALMQHADVGLIPFDRDASPDLVDAINPLKLYEYAAAGLPVVSTRWTALARLGSPALLSSTAEEFVGSIDRALEERPRLAKQMRSWVVQHTWAQRSREFLQQLDLD